MDTSLLRGVKSFKAMFNPKCNLKIETLTGANLRLKMFAKVFGLGDLDD